MFALHLPGSVVRMRYVPGFGKGGAGVAGHEGAANDMYIIIIYIYIYYLLIFFISI